MAYTKSHFVNNAIISAADVKAPLDNARTAINGGVASADLASGKWVEKSQVYGPSFFLSPDPRSDFTSAQTHWRMHPSDAPRSAFFNKESAKEKTFVPGLTATVKVESTSDVFIVSSWFAREFENKNKETTQGGGTNGDADFESFHVASFNLTSHTETTTTDHAGTYRRLYGTLMDMQTGSDFGGTLDWLVGSGKQYSMAYRFTDVSPGIYTYGIRIAISGESPGQVRNVQVSNRSFIVDIHPSS
jgi:hypothetical protein